MRILALTRAQWEIDETARLGQPGGFGSVFAGKASNGRAVAVKLIDLSVGDAAHRELEFAQAFAGRPTQHIVPILDFGVDGVSGQSCIVMSRANASLRDVMISASIDQSQAASIIEDVARGLIEAGDWIHRDLKPENILRIGNAWQIADFGIARIAQATTSDRTLKSALSPPYAAPEQWNNQRATHATDVYALGCIGIELLSGKLPFQGPEADDFARQHRFELPTIGDITPSLRSLLLRMMAKPPVARPTIEQVITEVGHFKAHPQGSGPGANKLSAAAATIAQHAARQEALALAEEARQAERDALKEHAYTILEGIAEQLFAEILRHAPQAKIETRQDVGPKIYEARLGSALIRMTVRNYPDIDEKDFERGNLDVICGDAVHVERFSVSGAPSQRRSASLWYSRIGKTGNYEWVEVAYWSVQNRIPTFLPPKDAGRVAAHNLPGWHIAHDPKAIEGSHTEEFCQRWMDFFARAVEGSLHPPTKLPEQLPLP